jgi:hypothetical protein
MSALDRQRQIEVSTGKTFINAIRVDSAKFGNEAHFVSFAAIVATRNGLRARMLHPLYQQKLVHIIYLFI